MNDPFYVLGVGIRNTLLAWADINSRTTQIYQNIPASDVPAPYITYDFYSSNMRKRMTGTEFDENFVITAIALDQSTARILGTAIKEALTDRYITLPLSYRLYSPVIYQTPFSQKAELYGKQYFRIGGVFRFMATQ